MNMIARIAVILSLAGGTAACTPGTVYNLQQQDQLLHQQGTAHRDFWGGQNFDPNTGWWR